MGHECLPCFPRTAPPRVCPGMRKTQIPGPARFQLSALGCSFKPELESHLRIQDAAGRSLLQLKNQAPVKTWKPGAQLPRVQHRTRSPAPSPPSPHSQQAPCSIHLLEHKQAPTGREINSLHPRTASCNEEAAAISLQQAATHMFDYNRLSHSTLPSARAQGKRKENTSTET